MAQVTFHGRDWRRAPRTAGRMFDVFTVMRQLHELLWYLAEALTLEAARPLHGELRGAFDETERLTHGGPDALAALDVAAHGRAVDALLQRASDLVRRRPGRSTVDRRGADLVGADLGRADLGRAIFLVQSQLEQARGDAATRLPRTLARPRHWARRTGPRRT